MNESRFPINRNALLIKTEYEYEAHAVLLLLSLIAALRLQRIQPRQFAISQIAY